QFTPKQVETRSERDKLMFRVKLTVPPERVLPYIERVKTGIRGVGYVKLDDSVAWPERLDRELPPRAAANAEVATSASQTKDKVDIAPSTSPAQPPPSAKPAEEKSAAPPATGEAAPKS